MSRSGYSDGCDNEWELICYRGAVASAARGEVAFMNDEAPGDARRWQWMRDWATDQILQEVAQ